MPPDRVSATRRVAAPADQLFRIVSDHGLAVPPEIAAVFRALATMEGTLTQLAPGFDIVAEARRFAGQQLAGQPLVVIVAERDQIGVQQADALRVRGVLMVPGAERASP